MCLTLHVKSIKQRSAHTRRASFVSCTSSKPRISPFGLQVIYLPMATSTRPGALTVLMIESKSLHEGPNIGIVSTYGHLGFAGREPWVDHKTARYQPTTPS